jgi:hypothetical protein
MGGWQKLEVRRDEVEIHIKTSGLGVGVEIWCACVTPSRAGGWTNGGTNIAGAFSKFHFIPFLCTLCTTFESASKLFFWVLSAASLHHAYTIDCLQ